MGHIPIGIFCLIFLLSHARSPIETVNIAEGRIVAIVPEIYGRYDRLLSYVYSLRVRFDKFQESFDKFNRTLISKGSDQDMPGTRPLSRLSVVFMGNNGSAGIEDERKVYSLIFSLPELFGWKIHGVLGPAEMRILGTEADPGISSVYGLVVHIREGRTGAFLNGPDQVDTVLIHPGIDPLLEENLISYFLQPDLAFACGSPLRSILSEYDSGRVVTSHTDFPLNRCGSRLLSLNPSSPGVLILNSNPPTVEFMPLVGNTISIWPSPAPVGTKPAELNSEDFDFTVVIPDIHGDIESFTKSLWLAYNSVSDKPMVRSAFSARVGARRSFPRSSKRVALVQLGDLIDKGPFTLECMDLMASLEPLFGWRIVSLFGNHEIETFDRKEHFYVHADDKLRDVDRFNSFSISGSLWQRFAQSAVMAATMRSQHSAVNILFVHGGIDIHWLDRHDRLGLSLSQANRSPVQKLNAIASYVSREAPDLATLLTADDSPVWFRGYEEMSDEDLCNNYLPRILDRFRVSRIIVGHCPQRKRRVRLRCSGRIILADVAITRWIYGTPNPMALVITHSETNTLINAKYLDESGNIRVDNLVTDRVCF